MMGPSFLMEYWESNSQPFINSFCHPHFNGTWASVTNELGAFTPCFIDIVILGTAHVVMIVFALLRIVALSQASTAIKLRLKYKWLQIVKCIAAVACAVVPLMQLSARASLDDIGGEEPLAPSETISLSITCVAWIVTALAFFQEFGGYVWNSGWYLRFAVLFVLVGQLAELHFVLDLLEDYNSFFAYLFFTFTGCHVLLGLMAIFYFPELVGGQGSEAEENGQVPRGDYVPLPAQATDEVPCPEYRVNFMSRLLFQWVTPIMAHGFKHPLQDTDVWDLDSSDTSEVIAARFQGNWNKEKARHKPWLFRAIHNTFGPRFWLGGVFKIGNDAAQFVGPLMLKRLLAAMQDGEPAWHGYLYACIIFVGLMCGVMCEAQYFQNVMRVGFQIRSALVSSVFRKSLWLSFGGRTGFSSGRIVNMMTTDAESMQMVCQNLHNLWSAPVRIVVAMALLYSQLGVSSLLGLGVLLLMIPVQAVVVNKNQKMLKQVLQKGDKRVELMNEIISSMDVVKCYAWEESFKKNILAIRGEELGWLRRSQYVMAVNYFMLNIVPVLVTVIGFGGFALLGGNLTADRAFTSITLFNVLRFPLYTFPQLITQVVNANVSLTRLQELLLAEERQLDDNPPVDPEKPAVEVHGANFNWDLKVEPPTLQGVTLEVPVGKLVAIVGGTGQGKSSLISALLGEMPCLDASKSPVLRGRVAYVPQVAWIFNASVRDNILFGLPYVRERYESVVKLSALVRDIDLLPGGDLTEIGERGVNVSGGQKQRIAIARALYSDADLFLFDDPLSALDAHVAKQVFENCLHGYLRGKTRVMVTNQLHFLPQVDYVFLLRGGCIVEQGTFEELRSNGPAFQLLMEQAGSLEDSEEVQDQPDGSQSPSLLEKKISSKKSFKVPGAAEEGKLKKEAVLLVGKEERETGRLGRVVIMRYVRAMGGLGVLLVLFGFYIMIECVRVSASVWISIWSGSSTSKGPKRSISHYIVVYASISVTQVFLTFCNQFWLVFSSQRAAKRLHEGMLGAILRAPMAFFHANPQGRLINRFTKDTGDIDKNLAQFCSIFLSAVFSLLSTFTLIGVLDTIALWAIVPLLLLFYLVYLYFQTTMREAKRLDSITRSPVYAQFGEALNGLSSIRAYRAQTRMAILNGRALDRNVRYTLLNMSANRWLAIRLEFLGGLMILSTAVFAVLDSQRAGNQSAVAPVIGLILSYALSITSLMTMTLRLASVAENSFNAVERVGTYTDVAPEAPPVIPDSRPPSDWPRKGEVIFDRVVMRYRADLPPVLHELSANIRGGEKVGVVGRTGAGKSSLFNTLFRIVEIESGTISIDSLDVHSIGLADLRRKLMIIPQTPVLFTGTVRFNLDPFNELNDTLIWEALGRAHLKDVVSHLPSGLNSQVTEGGDNFSVGQRQLLSLARALLRRSRILVLDEATAAVDVGTDALIQKTIREEFKECTMLIIAHRLNTIIDSDRILVMDAGRVVEYDTAKELLARKSVFFSMVQSTGAANAKYLQRIAMGEVDVKNELAASAAEEVKKWERQAASKQWTSATQWALAMSLTSSQHDLQEMCSSREGQELSEGTSLLDQVRDAAVTLQSVLAGERNAELAQALQQRGVVEERWWSALLHVIEGLAVMGRQVRNTLAGDDDAAPSIAWTQFALTGQNEPGQ